MLTPYDDLPYHQLPTTFDHAGTSDPRFFDRFWFIVYEREAQVALATGLGVYKNTNVCDGFAAAVADQVQHNVRASRTLRPDFSIGVGPLRYEVLEGLRRIRLICDPGAHGVSFDLVFEGAFDPFEEDHHFVRSGGVIRDDYLRYYQHGTASGSITVDGTTFTSDDFWSFRDRSFGVRPGMGGPMPPIAPEGTSDSTGMGFRQTPALFFGGAFSSAELAGTCTWAENSDGQLLHIDGRVVPRSGEPVRVESVEHDLRFHDDAVVAGGTVRYRLANGDTTEIELEEHGSTLVYPGFGYTDGYADRRGLGAYRGPLVVETDRYDVADPVNLRDLSEARELVAGTLLDQPMKISLNGQPGFMETVAGLRPPHIRYSSRGAQ